LAHSLRYGSLNQDLPATLSLNEKEPRLNPLVDELVHELQQNRSRVLVIAGAGVSRACDPNPVTTWRGLLQHGLQYSLQRCSGLTENWRRITEAMLAEQTADELIQAASRIRDALHKHHQSEYGKWLSCSIGELTLKNRRVIDAILKLGAKIVTTNYDSLFEFASQLRAVTWMEKELALKVLRGDYSGILHLHGHYLSPESVVLGSNEYNEICRDETAQIFLRSVFTLYTIVFVGCGAGIDDPNFSSLLAWSKDALKNCSHTHYHLITEHEKESITKQYHGLRVTPIVYGADFEDLPSFLEQLIARCPVAAFDVQEKISAFTQPKDFELQAQEIDADAELSAELQITKHFSIARTLWKSGGQRRAALHMQHTLKRLASLLSISERVPFVLETAECLILEHHSHSALELLAEVETVIGTLAEQSSHQETFRRLIAKALSSQGDYKEFSKFVVSSSLQVSSTLQESLDAERIEKLMLQGELQQAFDEAVQGREP